MRNNWKPDRGGGIGRRLPGDGMAFVSPESLDPDAKKSYGWNVYEGAQRRMMAVGFATEDEAVADVERVLVEMGILAAPTATERP
jgi:hypothetical protein